MKRRDFIGAVGVLGAGVGLGSSVGGVRNRLEQILNGTDIFIVPYEIPEQPGVFAAEVQFDYDAGNFLWFESAGSMQEVLEKVESNSAVWLKIREGLDHETT